MCFKFLYSLFLVGVFCVFLLPLNFCSKIFLSYIRDKTQIVLLLNRIEKFVESYKITILQSNVEQINLITKKLIYFEN